MNTKGAEDVIRIFRYILRTNVLDTIRTNKFIIDKIEESIIYNAPLIEELDKRIAEGKKSLVKRETPESVAFKVLLREDSYAAKHGERVGIIACDIAKNLVDKYTLNECLDNGSRLHDIGKMFFDSNLKYHESLNEGRELKDWQRELIKKGHVLIEEPLCIHLGISPEVMFIGACHHDNQEYPYPHKNVRSVLFSPYDISPKSYFKKGRRRIARSLDEIYVTRDIVSIADIVDSMRDKGPARKYNPSNCGELVYEELANRNRAGYYYEGIVEAFFKSEGLDKKTINELIPKNRKK